MVERESGVMHTWSGVHVDLANFTPAMVKITDIARSLRFLHRFNGHISRGFSVLEHSIIGSRLADTPEQKLEALLHDAGEAYVGDIILPLKEVIPEVCILEDKITTIIFDKLWPRCPRTLTGVYIKSPYMVKLDRDMARWESANLRPHHDTSIHKHEGWARWLKAYTDLRGELYNKRIEDVFFETFFTLQSEVQT